MKPQRRYTPPYNKPSALSIACATFARTMKPTAPKPTPADIEYVRSVLAGRVAASVCDGDLDPPTGARCATRAGFRAWLSRNDPPQRRTTPARPADRVTDNRADFYNRFCNRLETVRSATRRTHLDEPATDARVSD